MTGDGIPGVGGTSRGTIPTWIEVGADALVHNLKAVRGLLPAPTRLMAVVKANSYGHGPEAARILAEAGADMLAVTDLSEALELRDAGIQAPILVFSPLLRGELPGALAAGLTLTAACEEDLIQIAVAAAPAGQTATVHLKVDTGMGRLGVQPTEAPILVGQAKFIPGLQVEGIYTHFPDAAGRDAGPTLYSFRRFQEMLQELSSLGTRPSIAHCANSAATLRFPETHLDMVRVGTLLYGQSPAASLSGRLTLQNTWRLMSRVVSVKEIPAGWPVGYGSEYRARTPRRVAVVPVGYAHGIFIEVSARSRFTAAEKLRAVIRAIQGPGPRHVKIDGQPAPILGRVGMQLMTIDITDIPSAATGTLVEIPCRRVTSSARIPRVLV